jgi:predicted nucleic acid-binding protein
VIYILDATAIIAYLRGEPGADAVSAILVDPAHVCLAHGLNLCEVYYDFYRSNGETAAQDAVRDMFALGVQIRSDLSIDFWQMAGALKSNGAPDLAGGLLRGSPRPNDGRIGAHFRSS